MSVESSLLREAYEWIDARIGEFHRNGLSVEVHIAPGDREKQSVQWMLESTERIGEIILWESGEAELSFAVIQTGEVRPEHRLIDSRSSLEEALDAVLDWVSSAS
ncbi:MULTISPECIES: hypothetical protein [Actinomycetes]|uniref:Uncharacterized protein n=2 Tax=Actinomycetes TaxID=1760 RepID=A0ABP8SKB4_9ACTN|nr:hypothetical protein [Streptomyces sp. CMSTAAHL-2]MCE3032425.1 hypothetical protein [Streptomyces sp. CMSTAAHL-2]